VSMPDALVVLRAHAYVTGQRLSDLVVDLLASRVRLAPGPPRNNHQSSGSVSGDMREDGNSSSEQGGQQSAPRGEDE
jgi:hypothetical protein